MCSKDDHPSFGNKSFNFGTLLEWDMHNRKILKGDIIGITDDNTSNTKNCIEKVNQTSCVDFSETTDQLSHRKHHIYYWKCELERSIRDVDAEINILETLRQQLKNAIDTITIPEYITYECIDLRGNRMESDLIHDDPQKELYKEITLIQNIKKIQWELLRDVEKQMETNIQAKDDLEKDWSHKKIAFNFERDNLNIQTKSNHVKDSPGATKLSDGQSNVEIWQRNTITAINNFNNAMENSKKLRSKVDAVLINAARDLRTQDIQLNKVLNERIAQTERTRIDLENQLKLTLQKIVETENILQTLNDEILKVKQRLKVAQSRLTNKNCRPDVENCREGSLYSLIEEVRDLNDSLNLLENRYLTTEKLRADLIEERGKLENEIMVKKKTIHIDNERCMFLRSHFQSAEKLCGF